MVEKTTADLNESTANQDSQGTDDKPSFVTAEQLNAAITNRNKTLEKALISMQEKLDRFEKLSNPDPEPEKVSKISKLEATVEQMRREKEAEVNKRKDFELRNTVKEQLINAGVKPTFVKAVMAQLVDSDKMIGYSEDGNIVFKSRDQFGDVEVDLKDGIKSWSKLAEAKDFFVPKGAKGTGSHSPARDGTVIIADDNESTETLKNFFGLKGR